MDVHQYTAQSHLWLAIGIGSFLVVLSLGLLFVFWRAWRNSAAQIQKQAQLRSLCMSQQDAINWAIQEIGGNSSLVVPEALMERLIHLHSRYQTVMKGSTDEIS